MFSRPLPAQEYEAFLARPTGRGAKAVATSSVLTNGTFRFGVGTGEALNEHVLGPEATLSAPRPDVDLSPFHAQDHWSRSVTIWGGSSQVQRNIVAERVLGLPR